MAVGLGARTTVDGRPGSVDGRLPAPAHHMFFPKHILVRQSKGEGRQPVNVPTMVARSNLGELLKVVSNRGYCIVIAGRLQDQRPLILDFLSEFWGQLML